MVRWRSVDVCGVVASLLALSLMGCSKGEDTPGNMAAGSMAATFPAPLETQKPVTSSATKAESARKIVYTGEASLRCDNFGPAADKLHKRIKEFGGYVANASRSGTAGEGRQATWTIRIPSDNFNIFLQSLTGVGELQTTSVKAEDVSEDYYDAQARLKNQKIEEGRLLDLLKKDTGRLTDVLTVEHEVSRVREEVERLEGHIRFLENQTSYSTITVSLAEVKNFEPPGTPSVGTRAERAFSSSAIALRDAAVAALLMAIVLVPWLIVLLVVFVIIRVAIGRTRPREPDPILRAFDD